MPEKWRGIDGKALAVQDGIGGPIMTFKAPTVPAALLATLTILSAPAWAGQRDRRSDRSGQEGGRSVERSGGPRSESPRTETPRAEQRSEPRAEPRQRATAQQGEPRPDARSQRIEPRRDVATPQAESRREPVQPRREANEPRHESVGPGYEQRHSPRYEPRYAPRFDSRFDSRHDYGHDSWYDSRYTPRYNSPGFSYPYRPHYLYRQPYLFRPWFSLGLGFYAGYPVPYTYAYPYPVYGYSAPSAPVVVGPGSTAYGGASLDIRPGDAEVYVDGGFAGQVSDFDGAGEPLTLVAGMHRIEIVAQGYETLTIDAHVQPGQIIPYRGQLRRLQ